jgi:hypothetical protein
VIPAGTGAVALLLIVCTTAALSQERPSYQDRWAEATRDRACTTSQHPDFVLVDCPQQLTLWYFTKANHPAHPGVIKRQLSQEPDGSVVSRLSGSSYGSDQDQPKFKAWLAQIQQLDVQLRQDFERANRGR